VARDRHPAAEALDAAVPLFLARGASLEPPASQLSGCTSPNLPARPASYVRRVRPSGEAGLGPAPLIGTRSELRLALERERQVDDGGDRVSQPEQVAEPIDAVSELFVGPDGERQVTDRGCVGVDGPVRVSSDLSRCERCDQWRVGELNDREPSGPPQLG
jgi:hypothetical protein